MKFYTGYSSNIVDHNIELYSDKLRYNEVVLYTLYTHRIGRKAL